MVITKELRDVIAAKCDEKEKSGLKFITDSDITDIIEECQEKIPIKRKELEDFFEECCKHDLDEEPKSLIDYLLK